MSERREGLTKLGIVFDLDGTLIESTIDFGLMRDRVFRYLIDIGLGYVLERSDTIANNMDRVRQEIRDMNLDLKTVETSVEAICVEVEMMSVDYTKEVPGAGDALRTLRVMGISAGIVDPRVPELCHACSSRIKSYRIAGRHHLPGRLRPSQRRNLTRRPCAGPPPP